MKTKASIIVMSNLSDAQAIMLRTSGIEANNLINFAKFIILKTNGNLNQEVVEDILWKEFTETKFFKF